MTMKPVLLASRYASEMASKYTSKKSSASRMIMCLDGVSDIESNNMYELYPYQQCGG
jgi:hypothetical protein